MSYTSSWRSPSNIALIKYWGKHGVQLPRNPSLSFTLSISHTDMTLRVVLEATNPGLIVLFNGVPKPSFEPKIKSYFDRIQGHIPWVDHASIEIDSLNTFPHAAGIASSASAMSALALCLEDIDGQIENRPEKKDDQWWSKVSALARLGSGSACRSVFPVAALWGKMKDVNGSSDEYAIPWKDDIIPFFHDYQDTILIVNSDEKRVSSSVGHELMSGLAYATTRYEVAEKNAHQLINCMRSKPELDQFITICESEALQLHALMMSGDNPFILMQPNTISIINEIWRFRKESQVPVCFTLDAGPNVHLLYPAAYKKIVLDWIDNNLKQYCADGQYILDQVGSGPEKLK